MSSICDFFKERTQNLCQSDKQHLSPLEINPQDERFQSSPAMPDPNHCSTPTPAAKGKILCWNSFGMVKVIKNEKNEKNEVLSSTYEYIILSGKGINFSQVKLALPDSYELASISNTVAVLGKTFDLANQTLESKNQFTCICLKKWSKQHTWDGKLPFDETLKAVHTTEQFIIAISNKNVAYVYTLGGFLVYKWSLCGLYITGTTFGDDIFSVACVFDETSIETYVYRIGTDLLLLSKSSLRLITNHDQIITYTFTNDGILTIVTKLQFFYYSLVNSHIWCLYGRASFEFGGDFVGISTHIVNQQIKMRCYIPSIIQNFEQYHLLDYKEIIFEPLTRFNSNNNYVNVIQNEILFDDFKNKHNRIYYNNRTEDLSNEENSQREDILLDLFLYALKNKEDILTIDMFLLLKSPQHIKSATESASLSNQQKVISRIGEILAKRNGVCGKLKDPSNFVECEIRELSMKDKSLVGHENIQTFNNNYREILRQQRSSINLMSPPVKLKEINIDVQSYGGGNTKNVLKNLLLRKK